MVYLRLWLRRLLVGLCCGYLALAPAHAAPNAFKALPKNYDKDMVGATPADAKSTQWQVGLVYRVQTNLDGLFCGGTLYARHWVITAAHCFFDEETCKRTITHNDFTVLYGSNFITSTTARMGVEWVFLSPDYDCRSKRGDIALVWLKAPIIGPTVSIPSEKGTNDIIASKSTLQGVGWGYTEKNVKSYELLVSPLPQVGLDRCAKAYESIRVLPPSVMCAGGDGIHDACKSDSGGPLFLSAPDGGATQVGVISFGEGCASKKFPGVFTRVDVHKKWIDNTISQNGCTQEMQAKGYC